MSDNEDGLDYLEYEVIIRRLKAQYAAKKRQQIPGYRMAARDRRPEMWVKIAQRVQEVNAHPDDWIEAAFLYNRIPGGPFVNALYGPAAEGWYRAYAEVQDRGTSKSVIQARVEMDFQYLLDVLEQNKQEGVDETFEETLLDDLNNIAPYVRVVVAGGKLPRVTERWGKEAKEILDLSTSAPLAIEEMGYDSTPLYE